MSISTRRPLVGETSDLIQIWKTVFDDGDDDGFFSYYYDPELSVVATHEGVPTAAGYLLPAGNIVFGNLCVPCAMIYAVATLPEHRNLGYGSAVVNELIATGHRTGYSAIALCPATDSLFGYYSARTKLRECFYVTERILDDIQPCAGQTTLCAISPDEYHRLRKTMLKDIPHLEPDRRALLYQQLLTKKLGGGLFRAETSSGDVSCAVIERRFDGSLWIKELLTSGCHEADVLSAIASDFPASKYCIRTPALRLSPTMQAENHQDSDAGNTVSGVLLPPPVSTRRFAMLNAPDALMLTITTQNLAPWLGFAFD